MDSQVLSFTSIFIGAIVWLIEIILLMSSKRIVKENRLIIIFLNLAVVIYGLNEIFDKELTWQHLIALAVCIIIIGKLLHYFFGIMYRIHARDRNKIIEGLKKAFEEIENTEVQMSDIGDTSTFTSPYSKRRIEIRENESISGNKSYRISFKKWIGYESRKDIIYSIENYLYNFDEYKSSRLVLILQALSAVAMIALSIYMISQNVMEPRNVDVGFQGEVPIEIQSIHNEMIYSDKDTIIETLHEISKHSFTVKSKEKASEEIIKDTEFLIYYGLKGRTLYIGKNNTYLFISDSEIGNKSAFYSICWKVHRIYDKSNGTYYKVLAAKKIYKTLRDVQGNATSVEKLNIQ